jgi:Cu/Ag efflux protein CusF
MRTIAVFALGLVLCACSGPAPETSSSQTSKDEPVRHYALHGQVMRLDKDGKIATIKHEAIGDWMGAMTMEFPVKDQNDFAALREDEKINATVFVQGDSYWVGEVHEDTGTPPPAAK